RPRGAQEMGRIVGQIAKWPREPQNLSRDSGDLPPCPLRLEGRSGGLRNPLQSVRGTFRVEQSLEGILAAPHGRPRLPHRRSPARETGTTYGDNHADERAARRWRGASETVSAARSICRTLRTQLVSRPFPSMTFAAAQPARSDPGRPVS